MADEHSNKIFGQRLTQLRKARGITTQKELARRLGVSPATVHAWENGETVPRIPMLRAIAHELGVTMESLMHGGGQEKPALIHQEQTLQLLPVYLELTLQRQGAIQVVRADLHQLIATTRQDIQKGVGLITPLTLFHLLETLVQTETRAQDQNTDLPRLLRVCDELITLAEQLYDWNQGADRLAMALTCKADVLLQLGHYRNAENIAREAIVNAETSIRKAEPQRILLKALHKLGKYTSLSAERMKAAELLPQINPFSHQRWCLERAYGFAFLPDEPDRALAELKRGWRGFLQTTKTGILKDDLVGILFPMHIAQVAHALGGSYYRRLAKHVAFLGKKRSANRYHELNNLCATILATI